MQRVETVRPPTASSRMSPCLMAESRASFMSVTVQCTSSEEDLPSLVTCGVELGRAMVSRLGVPGPDARVGAGGTSERSQDCVRLSETSEN